mgnify:CR=1 FL=1
MDSDDTNILRYSLLTLWLFIFFWFIFDTSARGIFYESILLEASWFEAARFDCTSFQPLGLESACENARYEARIIVITTALVSWIFAIAMLWPSHRPPPEVQYLQMDESE